MFKHIPQHTIRCLDGFSILQVPSGFYLCRFQWFENQLSDIWKLLEKTVNVWLALLMYLFIAKLVFAAWWLHASEQAVFENIFFVGALKVAIETDHF